MGEFLYGAARLLRCTAFLSTGAAAMAELAEFCSGMELEAYFLTTAPQLLN